MDTKLLEKLKNKTKTGESGCWNWTGAKNRAGYGNTYLRGSYVNAHRAMWIAMHDAIPDGALICHSCDNPACINPSHLFVGTQSDNMADKSAKGRAKRGPCSTEEWWTPARREARAEQTRMAMQVAHIEKTTAAGVSNDWKNCPCCGTWKPRSEFYKNAARTDGLKPYCKPCSVSKDVARRRALGWP